MDSLVSTEWLEAHLGDEDLRVVAVPVHIDPATGPVTLEDAWAAGHVPGSVLADLPGRLSDCSSHLPLMMPPPEEFAAAMAELGVGQGTRAVIYDLGGNAWAARLWWMLHSVGFDDAAVLDGGWHKWQAEGRPVSTEVAAPAPARFVVGELRPVFVGKDEVRAALGDGSTRIVNALDADQHSGRQSFYGIRGHIPGAVNVPAFDVVDRETTSYLPTEELKEKLAPALDAERVVTYCGGGIAAASDAFLLHRLGHKNVAVYDGSLIEWGTDGDLPLETDDAEDSA